MRYDVACSPARRGAGLLKGIRYNMDGNADAYLIEGSDLSRWDAAAQGYVTETTVELSGASANCAWDQAAGACA